ncbi:MAG: hypothetical protein ABI614_03335 [Planctomycetota bacterium]
MTIVEIESDSVAHPIAFAKGIGHYPDSCRQRRICDTTTPMDTERKIDVATLDLPHRRALEDVIGHELGTHQQLIISVHEISPNTDDRPVQTLDDWASVYDGLTDSEVDAVDAAVKTRANLTREIQ